MEVDKAIEGQELQAYRPTMVMSAEFAAEQAEAIRSMTASILTKDVDYGVIPGTKKPSLLKPGAEWLLKWFGFGHEFDEPAIELDSTLKKWAVTYRCRVLKPMSSGQVITIATCDGHASRDEKKWEKAPWNTIIKMAQKRALVGAALQSTGTSGLFTQDLEDYAPSNTVIDLMPLIDQLSDAEKEEARALWKRSGWPSPQQMRGFQAAEAAFWLGQIVSTKPRDEEVVFEVEVLPDGTD